MGYPAGGIVGISIPRLVKAPDKFQCFQFLLFKHSGGRVKNG